MRNSIFDNLVNDENSFTELLCNLLRFKLFKDNFFEFLNIQNPEKYDCETQYRTDKVQKNGRPDLVICSDEAIFLIENKVNNQGLTNNQPKGYLNELSKMNNKEKHLYFIIPKYYSHQDELKEKLTKYKKDPKINTDIFFWEDFYENCRKGNFSKENDIFSGFFQLIKEWFGYDHIALPKKGDIEMNIKEFGKQLLDFENSIYTIENLLKSNGFKTKPLKGNGETGFQIFDKKNKILGYFDIWTEIWAAKRDIFVFIAEDNDVSLFNKEFKYYDDTFRYISLDPKILDGKFEEKVFVEYFIKEILNKIK